MRRFKCLTIADCTLSDWASLGKANSGTGQSNTGKLHRRNIIDYA